MHANKGDALRKKEKVHFRIRLWWVVLLFLVMWVNWRHDYTIYDEQQLVPVTCVYQEIFVKGGSHRANVPYIIDSQRQMYRLDIDNLRPLRDNLKPGDTLILKIEPSRSEFFPYDRRIAYLESNGDVYYTLEDYFAVKQRQVHQHRIILPLISLFLGVSLVVMFIVQNPLLWSKKEKEKMAREKMKQEKVKQLREQGKQHPKKQLQKKMEKVHKTR